MKKLILLLFLITPLISYSQIKSPSYSEGFFNGDEVVWVSNSIPIPHRIYMQNKKIDIAYGDMGSPVIKKSYTVTEQLFYDESGNYTSVTYSGYNNYTKTNLKITIIGDFFGKIAGVLIDENNIVTLYETN